MNKFLLNQSKSNSIFSIVTIVLKTKMFYHYFPNFRYIYKIPILIYLLPYFLILFSCINLKFLKIINQINSFALLESLTLDISAIKMYISLIIQSFSLQTKYLNHINSLRLIKKFNSSYRTYINNFIMLKLIFNLKS